MTGLSNDNPFRGNQLIQDTIGEETEDHFDTAFYGNPERSQEMNPATGSQAYAQDPAAEAEQHNLEVLYDGEDIIPPRLDEREGGESEAGDIGEEEEEEILQQNFVSQEIAFTPCDNLDGPIRDLGSTIVAREDPEREFDEGRHPIDMREGEGEEEEEEEQMEMVAH